MKRSRREAQTVRGEFLVDHGAECFLYKGDVGTDMWGVFDVWCCELDNLLPRHQHGPFLYTPLTPTAVPTSPKSYGFSVGRVSETFF